MAQQRNQLLFTGVFNSSSQVQFSFQGVADPSYLQETLTINVRNLLFIFLYFFGTRTQLQHSFIQYLSLYSNKNTYIINRKLMWLFLDWVPVHFIQPQQGQIRNKILDLYLNLSPSLLMPMATCKLMVLFSLYSLFPRDTTCFFHHIFVK